MIKLKDQEDIQFVVSTTLSAEDIMEEKTSKDIT